MAETGEAGWKRRDTLAGSAQEAIDNTVGALFPRQVLWARAYPGSVCLAAKFKYLPQQEIVHRPHEVDVVAEVSA
jgi:hypothetical protein